MTDAPDDIHNTNPLAPARLTIQIETSLGPRTVITSALHRNVASAIVEALAGKEILAAVHDDRGVHTIADLVRRKRAKEKRQAIVAAASSQQRTADQEGKAVNSIPAPNRYRKLFAEHPKSSEQYRIERETSKQMQRKEWPDRAHLARGLELNLAFEPVLVWDDGV